MSNFTAYLQQNNSGTVKVLTGTWVRLVNNDTAVAYISTTFTDSLGQYTINSIPPDTYTFYIGATAVGPWIATGNTNFRVTYSAGDDMVMHSGTSKPSSPNTATAIAGGADLTKSLRLAGGPWVDATHPSFAGGMKIDGATDDSAALAAAVAATPARGTTLIPSGIGTGTAVLNTAATFTAGWIPAEVTVMCMVILNLGTNVELDLDNIGARWIGGVISYNTAATDQYAMRMGKTRTSIQGVRFILGGPARTAAIRVSYARNAATAGTLTGGSILFCYFDAIGYGVLKQGSQSVTIDWLLADCMYVNGSGGDAIEWNGDGTPADFQLLITGWIIDGIARGGVVFAGIGIGITTGAYGLSDITEYQRFTFTANIINNGAEGIHIEACSRFSASGNVIANMTVTADLTGSGIVAYGSRYFSLRVNEVSDCTVGIQVSYGFIAAVYYFPDRFTIGGNDVNKCTYGIIVNCEGTANLARVEDNDLSECITGFSLRGQCIFVLRGNMSIGATSHSINATAISGGGTAKLYMNANLWLDFTPTFTSIGNFALVQGLNELASIHTISSIATVAGDILAVNANGNFSGAWGIHISGAGVNQDTYVRMDGARVAGNTGIARLKIQDSTGATDWAIISATAAQFLAGVQPGTGGGAVQAGNIFMGSGVPSNANGNNGDVYHRTDTPGTNLQRIYVKAAGAWAGLL